MGQVIFSSYFRGNGTVKVIAGWNHSLKGYYLTIFNKSNHAIFDNIQNGFRYPKDLDGHKHTFSKMEIHPPEGFWELMEKKSRDTYMHTDKGWKHSFIG